MEDSNKNSNACQTNGDGDLYFSVYVIWCRLTDMHYVGITSKEPYKRINQHRHEKRQLVRKEIQRVGWDGNFDWWVVEEHVPENLISEREQYWVALFDSVFPKGYNQTTGGIGHTTMSDDTREKLRQMALERDYSGERNPNYGRKHTEEELSKMRGRKRDAKARANISEARRGKSYNGGAKHYLYVKHPSDETRAKQSAARKGEKNPFYGKRHTEESLAKMRNSHLRQPSGFKGRHHTEEAKEKNRQAHLGKPSPRKGKHHTDDAKRKMSEARRGKPGPNKGKHLSEKTKALLRVKALDRAARKRARKSAVAAQISIEKAVAAQIAANQAVDKKAAFTAKVAARKAAAAAQRAIRKVVVDAQDAVVKAVAVQIAVAQTAIESVQAALAESANDSNQMTP